MEVLKKIRKHRETLGYTQFYMARKLGLKSAKAYGNLESGIAELTIQRLQKIAGLLDLHFSIELLEKKGENYDFQNQKEKEIITRLDKLIEEMKAITDSMHSQTITEIQKTPQ